MNRITLTHPGKFMSLLLGKEDFDSYALVEADLLMASHFHVDGELQKEFYSQDSDDEVPDYAYIPYGQIRPTLFALVKGKKLPLKCKLVLLAPKEVTDLLCNCEDNTVPREAVRGLSLTVLYQNGSVSLTTGLSLNTFLPDKSLENLWDQYIGNRFSDF